MAREPVVLPPGVEFAGESIRIRFTWNKKRCCETLPFPQTQKGIAAAASLRSQVKQLAKIGALPSERYAELFPDSRNVAAQSLPIFFDYVQAWLDSQVIVNSTRRNYRSTLQTYWIPHFAKFPLNQITPLMVRTLVANTKWTSPCRRRSAVRLLSSIFNQAIREELIIRNATLSVPKSRIGKRDIDPFTRQEADLIITRLYEVTRTKAATIYAAFFEFSFYTGMRPGEAMALRWDEVDIAERVLKIKRIRIYGKIEERTKTKTVREVLLNDRALQALETARSLTAARSDFVFAPKGTGDRTELYVRSETGPKRYWLIALEQLKLRRRRMYDTRHTYATLCLMSGMNPAFIAAQLGQSVQVLLSTYAKWISSPSDWDELEKLKMSGNGTKKVRKRSQ